MAQLDKNFFLTRLEEFGLLLLLELLDLLLDFVGFFVFHLLAQYLLNFSKIEQLRARIEAHGHVVFQVLLHFHLLALVVFLQLEDLFGDLNSEPIHPIVPLKRELLEFLTIVELDLLGFLHMLLDKAFLDTPLRMLPYNLNIL